MNRTAVAAIALATALAGGAIGFAVGGGGGDEAEREAAREAGAPVGAAPGTIPATPQRIAAAGIGLDTVAMTDLDARVLAAGRIVPLTASRAQVTARSPAVVVRLLVQLGDRVRAGQSLAVLDSRDAAAAQGAYVQATQTLAVARATLAREKLLWQQKVTAKQDYLAAAAAADAASSARDVAAAQLRALGVGEARIGRVRDLRLIDARAPIAGQISAVGAAPGEYVAAERALFEIADTTRVMAELQVPARDLSRVRDGSAVEIQIGDGGIPRSGRVRFLGPAIDPQSGAGRALVELANRDNALPVGTAVTARIAVGGPGVRALTVPRSAVQQVDGRDVVFVRTGTGFRAATVVLGDGDATRVTVRGGVAAGDRVASSNSFVLKAELGKGSEEEGE